MFYTWGDLRTFVDQVNVLWVSLDSFGEYLTLDSGLMCVCVMGEYTIAFFFESQRTITFGYGWGWLERHKSLRPVVSCPEPDRYGPRGEEVCVYMHLMGLATAHKITKRTKLFKGKYTLDTKSMAFMTRGFGLALIRQIIIRQECTRHATDSNIIKLKGNNVILNDNKVEPFRPGIKS